MIKVSGSSAGLCPKRLATSPPLSSQPAEPNPRFMDGHWHEFDAKRRLVEDGVVFERGLETEASVRASFYTEDGHPDGIVQITDQTAKKNYLPHPGRYLLEIKSMSQGSYWSFVRDGLRISNPSYYDQVQSYMAAEVTGSRSVGDEGERGKNVLASMYLAEFRGKEVRPEQDIPTNCLLIVKNKETGAMYGELVEFDPDHVDVLGTRWSKAQSADQMGFHPDKLHTTPDNYECKRCHLYESCWGQKTKVVDTSGLVNEAKTFVMAKESFDMAKEVMDKARKKLEGAIVEDGTVSVGGIVSVTRSTRRSVNWDSKILNAALTKEQMEAACKEKVSSVVTVRVLGG